MTVPATGPIVRTMLQTISYDPQSIRSRRERFADDDHSAWILCRNLEQYPIADDVTLRCLTEAGRVRPDDFLVDRKNDTCRQARDIPELRDILRRAALRSRLRHGVRDLILNFFYRE